MVTNPDYVRLSDHMVTGCVVDMDTGWSLSGYDVQPFPEQRDQQRFIRRKINAGVIEPASQAEYDTAHPEDDEEGEEAQEVSKLGQVLGAAMRGGGGQEHRIRERETARHSTLQASRARAKLIEQGVEVEDDASLEEAEYAEEQARLEALQSEQDEADLSTDDPEEQQERTATRAPAKKTAAKKAASTRKRS